MGQRGPKTLPANVHLLNGNPSKKSYADLLGEFRPDVEIPDCPTFLLPEAKRHWKELTPEFAKYGLVAKIDRGIIAMACQEWARWQWAEKKIRELNRADKANGEAGLVERAPSGYRMQSVYLQISVKAEERYEKLVGCFGVTPSARTRVSPSDVQGELFEQGKGDEGAAPAPAQPPGFARL